MIKPASKRELFRWGKRSKGGEGREKKKYQGWRQRIRKESKDYWRTSFPYQVPRSKNKKGRGKIVIKSKQQKGRTREGAKFSERGKEGEWG